MKSVNWCQYGWGVTLLSNKPNLDCVRAGTRLSLVLLCGVQYED